MGMTQNTWKLFPQLLEQKIQQLLNEAVPNQRTSFMLYKACTRENLWNDTFEKFSLHLKDFFSQPKDDRSKSYFDIFLNRPMDSRLYDGFSLTFRTGMVNAHKLLHLASWTHQQLRLNCHTESVVIADDVLGKTFRALTSPLPHEKDSDIEFEDFCIAWKKTVFKLFGKKYEHELEPILKELRWLNEKSKAEEPKFTPTIYLTQTEIDWTEAVLYAVKEDRAADLFPLSRGPEKIRLVELQRAADLYNKVKESPWPEIKRHLENVRRTILDKCETLLRERAR